MKAQILIIEDNCYKYFTTKQLLEAKLNIKLKVEGVDSLKDLEDKARRYKGNNIMYRPEGGVIELLKILKKRRVNRLNTEVTLLLTPELSYNSKHLQISSKNKEQLHCPAA